MLSEVAFLCVLAILVTDHVTGLEFQVFDPNDKMRILFPVMFERPLYAYGVQMNKGYVIHTRNLSSFTFWISWIQPMTVTSE